MKKRHEILLHLFFWAIMIFNKLLPNFSALDFFKPLNITFLAVSFLAFYFNYLIVIPFLVKNPKPWKFILGLLISFFFFIYLRYITEELILLHITGHGNYAKGTSFGYYIFDNFYWGSNAVFISSLIWFLNYAFKLQKEKQRLLEQKNAAEMSLLKSQINPHFIFNTLNNIYSLVNQKSEKSLDAIEKLGNLLRFSGIEIGKDFTNLENEIQYLKNFIDLESLRIANPENIIFEDNIENKDLKIAPMTLIPFVENAFKHGDLKKSLLEITIKTVGYRLYFHQKNKISKSEKDISSGIGIENVKRRLSIIYPEKYILNINNNGEFYEVNLMIELNQ